MSMSKVKFITTFFVFSLLGEDLNCFTEVKSWIVEISRFSLGNTIVSISNDGNWIPEEVFGHSRFKSIDIWELSLSPGHEFLNSSAGIGASGEWSPEFLEDLDDSEGTWDISEDSSDFEVINSVCDVVGKVACTSVTSEEIGSNVFVNDSDTYSIDELNSLSNSSWDLGSDWCWGNCFLWLENVEETCTDWSSTDKTDEENWLLHIQLEYNYLFIIIIKC